MTTTDPLHDALDQLARLADDGHVPDRLDGIRRRHRARRDRRAVVGAAAAIALVAGGVGLAGSVAGPADRSDAPPASQGPTPAVRPTLEVALRVGAIGEQGTQVSYTITGTSGSFRDSETGQPMEQGGPLGTRVLVDGDEVTGTDGGLVECDPDGTPEAYDLTFGPQQVQVPEGEHTLSVEVEYCGPDGDVLTATDATTAFWPGQGSVVDHAGKDLDGDGTRERLVLVDEGDRSALLVSGSVSGRVELGAMVPGRISGASDLDGDGTVEVLVDVDLGELVQTVVVTLDRRGAPTLVGSSGGPPELLSGLEGGRFHGAMLIDGVLTSWEGEGDGGERQPVTGGTWTLDGTTLRLTPFGQQLCGSAQVSPQPC